MLLPLQVRYCDEGGNSGYINKALCGNEQCFTCDASTLYQGRHACRPKDTASCDNSYGKCDAYGICMCKSQACNADCKCSVGICSAGTCSA